MKTGTWLWKFQGRATVKKNNKIQFTKYWERRTAKFSFYQYSALALISILSL
jgi:hypothetical protein